jgi:hypothetical protein
MRRPVFLALSLFFGLLNSSSGHAGTVLVTEQEASLPVEKVTLASRGITRGPHVELIEPGEGEAVHSPMHFQVRFRAFGSSKINTDTLQLTYLKVPEINILSRVSNFVQSGGIDISDAEIPPGDHFFRIAISDSEGRTRSSVFELKVSP